MTIVKNILSLSLLLLFCPFFLNAQNPYTIYPIPQEQVAGNGKAKFSLSQIEVICEEGIDEVTRQRLVGILNTWNETHPEIQAAITTDNWLTQPTNTQCTKIFLGINGSNGAADSKVTEKGLSRGVFSQEGKFDRHIVDISSSNDSPYAEIIILGEHTDAVFYGLASLEQMLDQSEESELDFATLNDYADQQSRGLVEGYYGYPYTITVKKDLMKFMMRHKMNTYMYGVKGDPYHSEHWTEAYPTSITPEQEKNGWLTQEMIKDLTKTATESKVNFVWAIHPGNSFTNSSTVISDIMGKYDKMHKLGVRQFAVFVDDVDVPQDASVHVLNANRVTELQQALEAKYNAPGAVATDTVKPLHFVPQVYASSFVGESVRRSFFQALSKTPKNVTIYTTGWGVWSVPNSSDLYVVKEDLGRDVAWWWNYPCNDNADGQLYTMDTYSNFYDMPAVSSTATLPSNLQHGIGIVSNPMQEGQVSKTALFSVADYAWNNSGFNNQKSWEASFNYIVDGENVAAYKKLAEYLRYNDPANLNKLITNYKTALKVNNPDSEELRNEMQAIYQACQQLVTLKDSERESDRLLYTDLSPWLLKLQQMASSVCNLMDVASINEDNEQKWNLYAPEVNLVNGLNTEEAYKAYALEGMGSWTSVSVRQSQPSELYLRPFVDYLKENVLGADYFRENNSNTSASIISNINTSTSLGNIQSSKGNINLFIPKAITLNSGEYIGISLPESQKLSAITMADTLLTNYEVIHSENGKIWYPFKSTTDVPETFVKYICIKNTSDAPRSFKAVKATLLVSLPTLPEVSKATAPEGAVYENNVIGNLTDGDYSTFFIQNRHQQNGDVYMLTLKATTKITDVRLCMGTTNNDYMHNGRVQVSADGKTWENLRVKGTTRTSFTMTMQQVVKYSDDMSYIDFAGDNIEARYVRLYVENANTNKWMRIAEIEVNKQGYNESIMPHCQDGQGTKVSVLTDQCGYTCQPTSVKSPLIYHLQQPIGVSSIILYSDAAEQGKTINVQATTDGENWLPITTLSQNYNVINMQEFPLATALKIEWEGEAPAIYEIQEMADPTILPVVSDIDAVLKPSAESVHLRLTKGGIYVESTMDFKQVRVYNIAGQLINVQPSNGVNQMTIPLNNQGQVILSIDFTNGQSISYKVQNIR